MSPVKIQIHWSLHNSNNQGDKDIVRVIETFELQRLSSFNKIHPLFVDKLSKNGVFIIYSCIQVFFQKSSIMHCIKNIDENFLFISNIIMFFDFAIQILQGCHNFFSKFRKHTEVFDSKTMIAECTCSAIGLVSLSSSFPSASVISNSSS